MVAGAAGDPSGRNPRVNVQRPDRAHAQRRALLPECARHLKKKRPGAWRPAVSASAFRRDC